MQLRKYQQECIDAIPESGRYVIVMATGLGKSFVFSQIPRRGRMLILSHREELVEQPRKYFSCSYGVEMAGSKSKGEEVVSASVQSLVRRLNNFKPDDFDLVIVDEMHHSASKTYKTILSYFKPRLLIGVTATPNRNDGRGLDDLFDKIIFNRDLKWGIENGYLSRLECMRVNIGVDLSNIKTRLGDFAQDELEKAMNENKFNVAIAEAYRDKARGQTLIFACSVAHAHNLNLLIEGSKVIDATTKNRSEILDEFRSGQLRCLINCMIFTEGTDLPMIETIIIARPTSNSSLYTQMVGRGLRLYPGKEKALLIDIVGNIGKVNLCTAPTLLGLQTNSVPKAKLEELEGDLFLLPAMIERYSDCPQSWVKNYIYVDIWAKEMGYNTHHINFFKMPNGDLVLKLKDYSIKIDGDTLKMQDALDNCYKVLCEKFKEQAHIWDLRIVKKWGKYPASDKQLELIKRKKITIEGYINKMEASQILNRVMA